MMCWIFLLVEELRYPLGKIIKSGNWSGSKLVAPGWKTICHNTQDLDPSFYHMYTYVYLSPFVPSLLPEGRCYHEERELSDFRQNGSIDVCISYILYSFIYSNMMKLNSWNRSKSVGDVESCRSDRCDCEKGR